MVFNLILPLLLALSGATQTNKIAIIPFELDLDHHIYVKTLVGSVQLRMMLDTGAGRSILEKKRMSEARKHLNVLPEGRYVTLKTQLEGFVGYSHYYNVDPMPIFTTFSSKPVDGILGNDLFESNESQKGCRVTYDFVHNQVVVNSEPLRPTFPQSATTIALPLTRRKDWGWYYVRVPVYGGGTHNFLVDTGTPDIVIDRATLSILGTANKQISRYIDLVLGNKRVHTKCYDGSETPCPFILGLEVLKRYRFTIDFRDKMLYLEPPQ